MRNVWVVVLAMVLSACAGPGARMTLGGIGGDVIVIAHRGASGERPEHTLEAYRLAIAQGADFIEPDLVMTSDGVLVARHDPWLSDSTDVADRPEFAARRSRVTGPDGTVLDDWFAWDFTLAELKTLRAKQVRAGRPTAFDGQFDVPTFEEIIVLVAEESERTGRTVGFYPETKWPVEHAARGLDMEEALVAILEKYGLTGGDAPVFVQSFEPEILKRLDRRIDTPLVQLVFPPDWSFGTPANIALEDLATYADGVGPYRALMIDPATGEVTDFGVRARALGLEVHPWTFRDDDKPVWAERPEDEIRAAIRAGATGFFTDFPATGRRALDRSD